MFQGPLYIIAGFGAGFLVKSLSSKQKELLHIQKRDEEINRFKEEMNSAIEKKEKEIDAEKKRIREDIERKTGETRENLKKKSIEIDQRVKKLDQKADIIERKEAEIEKREKNIETIKKKYEAKEKEVEEMKAKEESVLKKISRFSPKQAREEILKRADEEAREEAKRIYERTVENAKRSAQKEAVEIIAQSIQRNASEVTQELTVTSVSIPDEDMKGRIIGREGRNIRSFEAASGVNLIIDDTPGVITISSFDGIRREIARRSLNLLIKDGRIQPSRIEEVVSMVKSDIGESVRKSGEKAAMDAGVVGLHDELINLLGKLEYRTSYGQNVLEHSVSVANLAGLMADELNVDSDFARRAGILHDIGKAVDREIQGNHSQIGAKLAKKYGESGRVQNAIMAHHEKEQPQTVEAVFVAAADAISASRPGARREQIQHYVRRMEDIESIAKSFEGVKEAYCLSAGREIRIIVEPDKISDSQAAEIAKECARKIEDSIEFPGEVKVAVIRSMRNVETAR